MANKNDSRLSILKNWVDLTMANMRDPCSLASDHLTIPSPCYLRILYPEEKEHGLHTIERFFDEVDAEVQRRCKEEELNDNK